MMKSTLARCHVIGAAVALSLVGGCSDAAQDDPAEAPASMAAAPAEPAETVAPSQATQTPEISSIPVAMRGRWGLVPADCTSTRGDAKGLVVIGADSLRFYESVAKLGAVRSGGPDRIRADYALTGEGQEWRQDIELTLLPDGSLQRRDRGENAMPGPLAYARCAPA